MLKRVKFLIVDFAWNWRIYFEGKDLLPVP